MRRRWLCGCASVVLSAIVGLCVWALAFRTSILRDVSTVAMPENPTYMSEEVQNLRKEVTILHQAMQNAEPSSQFHAELPAVSSEPSAVGHPAGNNSLSLEALRLHERRTLEDAHAAKYCKPVLSLVVANPNDELRLWGYVKSQSRNSQGDHSKRAFHGQKYADVFLYSVLWKHLDRPGVYVDLAANDYRVISNTYFADHCLKFRGLCIEANPKYWPNLDERRHCAVVKTCIAEKPRNVSFLLDEEYGGVADVFKGDGKGKYRTATFTKMRCDTLSNVFRQYNVKHVDYMNLDVEGSELQCLQGIDWKAVRIDVIAVERNPKFDPLKEFLLAREYIEAFALQHDTVFVHSKADSVLAAIAAWRKTHCTKVVKFMGQVGNKRGSMLFPTC